MSGNREREVIINMEVQDLRAVASGARPARCRIWCKTCALSHLVQDLRAVASGARPTVTTTTTHDMSTRVGLRRRYSLEDDVIIAKMYFVLSV